MTTNVDDKSSDSGSTYLMNPNQAYEITSTSIKILSSNKLNRRHANERNSVCVLKNQHILERSNSTRTQTFHNRINSDSILKKSPLAGKRSNFSNYTDKQYESSSIAL